MQDNNKISYLILLLCIRIQLRYSGLFRSFLIGRGDYNYIDIRNGALDFVRVSYNFLHKTFLFK